MNPEIKTLILDFFEKLNIGYESIGVVEEEWNICNIIIKTPHSWILIGQWWKNLDSIELILKVMILKSYDVALKIHIEVNDYLYEKTNRLKEFVNSQIQIIEKTKKDIIFPFFWAYERKKIHTYILESGKTHISTKSIWEWKERRIHLCISNNGKKLSIDIDTNDI